MIIYGVYGIGYDADDRITDDEWYFGESSIKNEMLEKFSEVLKTNPEEIFKKDSKSSYLIVQLEKCKEDDEHTECLDVIKESYIDNPYFRSENNDSTV